jgi:methionyl-tRNA formyltransferase
MRLILLGAGEFGLPTFRHLHQVHQVRAVVSQPDRPAGRKRQMTPTPIAAWAIETGLPLHRWEDVNQPAIIETLRAYDAEVAVVIAFGQKLSRPLLDALAPLTVNVHSSLLPRWRGASPINSAILAGDTVTGVSVISLADRMDAGLVYAQRPTAIFPEETAGELHDRLSLLGIDAIDEVLAHQAAGTLHGHEQDESKVTLARKLSKARAGVDFTQSASQVKATINGLTPWPGAQVTLRTADGDESQLFLRRAGLAAGSVPAGPAGSLDGHGVVACGEGGVQLLEVQKPGGKVISFEAFARGCALSHGDRLFGI